MCYLIIRAESPGIGSSNKSFAEEQNDLLNNREQTIAVHAKMKKEKRDYIWWTSQQLNWLTNPSSKL